MSFISAGGVREEFKLIPKRVRQFMYFSNEEKLKSQETIDFEITNLGDYRPKVDDRLLQTSGPVDHKFKISVEVYFLAEN